MQKVLSAVSKLIAALFAILFVVATFLALPLLNLQHTLLDAETYKRALAEDHVYEQLPALVAEQPSALKSLLGARPGLDQYATLQNIPAAGLPDDDPLSNIPEDVQACAREALGSETYETLSNGQRSPTKQETRRINACIRQARREARLRDPGLAGELVPLLNDFSEGQWEALIHLVLPPDDLQRMTDSALDQLFFYLNGDSDTVSVSLVDLKARLTGQAGEDLILFLLASKPPCTAEQRAHINAGKFENGGAPAIYCAASGATLANMIPEMQNRLDRLILQIPDQAVLIQPAPASYPAGNGALFRGDALAAIRTIRKWIWLSPLLSLVLLLLVAAFGVRSVKGWLRWWGIPLFVLGMLTLAEGAAAQSLLDWVWVNYAAPRISLMFSSGLSELGHALLLSAAAKLGKWLMIEAGLIALLGLAAIIRSFYIRPKFIETPRSFAPPELSQEYFELVRSRHEDGSPYS